MGMLIIPEFVLLDAVKKGLAFVRADYELNKTHEEKSYLYKVLGGTSIERYDYFTQGKNIFLCGADDPRLLTVDLMYNIEMKHFPSVYIALAAEQHGQNGLGVDEGFKEYEFEDETDEALGTSTPVFTRRQNTSYNLMIMSDNSSEVILIYHFLKALLISLHPHLNIKGLENLTFSGQDLQLNSELIPKHAFMRAINLGLQYEASSPDLRTTPMITNLLINESNAKEQ
jgi:hypothetical protein